MPFPTYPCHFCTKSLQTSLEKGKKQMSRFGSYRIQWGPGIMLLLTSITFVFIVDFKWYQYSKKLKNNVTQQLKCNGIHTMAPLRQCIGHFW